MINTPGQPPKIPDFKDFKEYLEKSEEFWSQQQGESLKILKGKVKKVVEEAWIEVSKTRIPIKDKARKSYRIELRFRRTEKGLQLAHRAEVNNNRIFKEEDICTGDTEVVTLEIKKEDEDEEPSPKDKDEDDDKDEPSPRGEDKDEESSPKDKDNSPLQG